MATNTLKVTTGYVVKETLAELHSQLTIARNTYRVSADEFTGAKNGSTVAVRAPTKFVANSGRDVSSAVQNIVESTVDVTLAQKNVAAELSLEELTTYINLKDMDGVRRIVRPAAAVLASAIDAAGFAKFKSVNQSVGNSTYGNAITFSDVLAARTKLNQQAVPRSDRFCYIDSASEAAVINELKANFNPNSDVAKQNREGYLGNLAGFQMFGTDLVGTLTAGTADNTTPLVNQPTAVAEGASQIAIDGLDPVAGTFKAGQIVTFSGVYDVHPETKATYSHLKQFVVTADATADTGAVTLSVYPAFYASATDGRKNISALPADGATVTILETASSVSPIGLACHRDAFALATVPMVLPSGTDMAAQETYDGINLRMVADYQASTDLMLVRFDVLFGWGAVSPERACRIVL